ncbi:hypothetical protein GUITHDRAFT_140058 [Guillardia theta CCMP2712]|uniref:Uncharacterized protein n=1 Tax=Guillardia theta (strain CCMP2712) TaxID=905079 RepID=L1J762_GUITC|nr:hypothetical protein GUITHDRAFT_140058 [Guillardia theta CCMP2712]EKX43915.1 hypothetical protein GUITHDRAFT_140058 [Guillardia theta CCMP2712]|eukprot:XP_005830895.1 hypothetical protein GUITHDRAFT_140058 [Guillardia theta CCMP2712]
MQSKLSRLVSSAYKKESSNNARFSKAFFKVLKEAMLLRQNALSKKGKNRTVTFFQTNTHRVDDAIPGIHEQKYVESIQKLEVMLNDKNEPPMFLRFYFPDLYQMVLQDPTKTVYENENKREFLLIQKRIIDELDERDKLVLKAWTYNGNNAINRLLTYLFDTKCIKMFKLELKQEDIDGAIAYFCNIKILKRLGYFEGMDDPIEALKANNYSQLQEIMTSYISDLYRIADVVKSRTLQRTDRQEQMSKERL